MPDPTTFLLFVCAFTYLLIGGIAALTTGRRATRRRALRIGVRTPTVLMLMAIVFLWLPFLALGALMEGLKWYQNLPKPPENP